MQREELEKLESALEEYTEYLTNGMGRLETRESMAWYLTGLLLDGERKSMQPMAARLVEMPEEIEPMRQRLQECVSVSPWSDDLIRMRLAQHIERKLPNLEAFIFDDTGFPKQGKHSVGVARQYSGTLGKVGNCQVAPSLHLAGEKDSCCLTLQLYLPKEWASDPKRRQKAGIPDDIQFQTKWQIALALLKKVTQEWGLKKRIVLADSGYGKEIEFRQALREQGYQYSVGVTSEQVVWAPGTGPIPPDPTAKRNRGQPRWADGKQSPQSLLDLALSLGRKALQEVSWREGSKGPQLSWFHAVRVRVAHHHVKGKPPWPEEWLIYEWPEEEEKPSKYWLSNLPPETSLKELVRVTKLRWHVERDYQDLKEEVGLDHFEGRKWRGFHHHVTLCLVAHGFLALQRALFPPPPNQMDAFSSSPTASDSSSPALRLLS
jgi:SRSO17 transposase